MMKISYDQEVDALYIRLVGNLQECRTVRLTDEITLNIGADEQLVGIEILDAVRNYWSRCFTFCGVRKYCARKGWIKIS